MATPNIREAIAASAEHLDPALPISLDLNDFSASLHLVHAEDLSAQLRDSIYGLFDANMADVSKDTSMVYTEEAKREELFDPLTRYLLILRSSPSSSSNPSSNSPPSSSTPAVPAPAAAPASPQVETLAMPGALPPQNKDKDRDQRSGKSKKSTVVDLSSPEDLLGYCSFRFDTEETLGDTDVEVVYCYEVQLSPSVRRKGVGDKLMRRLEDIGAEWGMFKSMLTCLKANTPALAFYAKLGYMPDEIDPTRMAEEESESEQEDEEEDEDADWEEVGSDGEPLSKGAGGDGVDYVILSKNLQGQ